MAKRNLVGLRFCKLTVIKENGKDKYGNKLWLCQCDCGNTTNAKTSNLNNGSKKSCGCLRKNVDDLTGQRFGRLVVLKTYKKEDYYCCDCICDCGNTTTVYKSHLTSGATQSCGCLARELTTKRNLQKWNNEEYRKLMKGETHPSYKPELTEEERKDKRLFEGYEGWKKQVKEQANFTCNCCGKRGGNLHSHHLDGYRWCVERRLDISNGVCLCEHCHREFHTIYGIKHNTEQQYIEFKNNRLKGDD